MALSKRVLFSLSINELARIRAKATRSGIWFKVLNRAERALIDLTLRIVKRVRSFALAKALASVVKKLLDPTESRVVSLMRTVGRDLARKVAELAVRWGNSEASRWAEDPRFMQYLTITEMNTSSIWRAMHDVEHALALWNEHYYVVNLQRCVYSRASISK